MKKKLLLVLILPVLYSLQSCDDARKAKNYNQESAVDQGGLNFIDNAVDGGRTEIKLSTVAEHVSQNLRVLSFARMMVSDHTSAIEELKRLQKKELVNPDDLISKPHRKMIDSISKLTGSQFDKAYMQQMVTDHEKTLDLFKQGSQDRANAVQSYAQKILPTIQMHLDSARAINEALK